MSTTINTEFAIISIAATTATIIIVATITVTKDFPALNMIKVKTKLSVFIMVVMTIIVVTDKIAKYLSIVEAMINWTSSQTKPIMVASGLELLARVETEVNITKWT